MNPVFWQTEFGDGPTVACAVHDGHDVRPEVACKLLLAESERRYEEDPGTGDWTSIATTRIVGRRSRFEVDLNRPREKAVYLTPNDCWGLRVWRHPPSQDFIARSLVLYDEFYAHLRWLLERLVQRHGRVVLFDLHSYNHRGGEVGGGSADREQNPEVNLGTGSMRRVFWAPIVDRWLTTMRQYDYLGRRLDVRENVRFLGGYLPQWVHQHFPDTVCALAIEVNKRVFMDERTGELDSLRHQAIGQALAHAASAVHEVVLETW